MIGNMHTLIINKHSPINLGIAAVLLFLWIGLTFEGAVSTVKIWYISDIFNHCFLVLPMSFYLIWEKRNEIQWQNRECTLFAIPFIIMQVFLYVIGVAGDIQLFQHAAMFSLLPTIIWFYLGNKITKQIIFPLCFMLFAIPFGEEFIPFLQEITADISTEMISWTGVPLYRSGLFLEIPQGRFLVAEACSGVSFLIASVVLGNLYAYMNLKRMTTRIFFVLLSIALPILANAIRVFGTIMIGYASDMKYAAGADHLIYGWFFFAFVIICLLSIGELIRRWEQRRFIGGATTQLNMSDNNSIEVFKTGASKLGLVSVILVFGIIKSVSINSVAHTTITHPEFTSPFNVVTTGNSLSTWQPSFNNSTRFELLTLAHMEHRFVYFTAYYDGTGGELVSTQHNLFGEKSWSLSSKSTDRITDEILINNIELKSAVGHKINVYYLYIINGVVFNDTKKAKLYQVWLKLQGKPYDGVFLAISDSTQIDNESKKYILTRAINEIQSNFTVRGK
jgi:exosortase A